MPEEVERIAYSVVEAAQIAGIGRTGLYQLISDGRIPAVKIGKRTLVRRSDLEAFMAALPTSRPSRNGAS
jgi:excisionase family DNA binding protein